MRCGGGGANVLPVSLPLGLSRAAAELGRAGDGTTVGLISTNLENFLGKKEKDPRSLHRQKRRNRS